MRDLKWIRGFPIVTSLLLACAVTAGAEEAPHRAGMNVSEMKFMAFPGMPTCSTGSVVTGDPTKGPSIILARMNAGCTFPWHWHTPTESLMLIRGEAVAQMKDGAALTMTAGAFAQMPTQHIHQFSCVKDCLLYVHSDAAFDMHYVDGEGKEISPDAALKPVMETAAPAPK